MCVCGARDLVCVSRKARCKSSRRHVMSEVWWTNAVAGATGGMERSSRGAVDYLWGRGRRIRNDVVRIDWRGRVGSGRLCCCLGWRSLNAASKTTCRPHTIVVH